MANVNETIEIKSLPPKIKLAMISRRAALSDNTSSIAIATFTSYEYYHLPLRLVMRSVTSVCVSVCPVHTLTFQSLDLESSFLMCRYIFRISTSSSYIKVIGSRSRSFEQNVIRASPNTKYTQSRVVRLPSTDKIIKMSNVVTVNTVSHW